MMQRSRRSETMRWCHVVWAADRHHELFKIPAAARFCERVMRTGCGAKGWQIDTIVLATDRIHVLVKSPARLSRQAVIRTLQRVTRGALRRAGLVARWERRLWADWAWCRVLTAATSVTAVRRWLIARRAAQHGGWDWRWEIGGAEAWSSGERKLENPAGSRDMRRLGREATWRLAGE